MSTPNKGKKVAVELDKSLRNFHWSQPFEDTLLDLLVRETRNGNRPDASFTAVAFRNVVTDFNRIHGTSIMKNHILSRINTMKQHFNQFHVAFNGLSGFSWNHETKMFQAEESLWEERIEENPNLKRLRDKPCHNWDLLLELYGDTRANGNAATGLRGKLATIQRGLNFAELCLDSLDSNVGGIPQNEASSFGEYNFSTGTPDPATLLNLRATDISGRAQLKRKASLIDVMEDGYKIIASNIRELSMALVETGDRVAGSKYDPRQNDEIYAIVESLGFDEDYKFNCYLYLTANPAKAAQVVGAPGPLHAKMVDAIMKEARLK